MIFPWKIVADFIILIESTPKWTGLSYSTLCPFYLNHCLINMIFASRSADPLAWNIYVPADQLEVFTLISFPPIKRLPSWTCFPFVP